MSATRHAVLASAAALLLAACGEAPTSPRPAGQPSAAVLEAQTVQAVEVPEVYWTGRDGTVNHLDLSTGVSTTLAQPYNNHGAIAIAVDPTAGKLYWTARNLYGSALIIRSNLDGSDLTPIVGGIVQGPEDLALDIVGGYVYWKANGYLWRARTDGSGEEALISSVDACPGTLSTYKGGLAFDPTDRYVYFGDRGGLGICRTQADGSGPELAVGTADAILPRGMAIAAQGRRIYYVSALTSYGGMRLKRANLDGGAAQELYVFPYGPSEVGAVAIDEAGGKLYWPEYNTTQHFIARVNLDGSGLETVAVLGQEAVGIAVAHVDHEFSCGAVAQIPQSECEALVAFYQSTDGDNWVNNTGWLQTDTPCSWWAVFCGGGHVTRLIPVYNGLKGSIPAEIGDFGSLEVLSLYSNELTGPIPAELGKLASLRALDLDNNQLSGSIPDGLGNLGNLVGFYLYSNQLTGPIPADLGALDNLEVLDLSYNQLTGPIPAGLGGLAALTHLQLQSNQLTGAIPEELANLSDLESLALFSNQLSGSIPATLGQLGSLQDLVLASNHLTGPIPPELGNLTSLTWLRLQGNQLTGPIPPELGNIPGLQHLDASANELTGPIPAELGGLPDLQALYLGGNQLDGLVPFPVAELGVTIPCQLSPNPDLYMPATPDYQALGNLVCGIELTPLEDMASEVTGQISDLVASGELISGLGNALTTRFEKALEKLNEGKLAPAAGMLNGLIDQINDLIEDGQISAAEGGNLILLASALLP